MRIKKKLNRSKKRKNRKNTNKKKIAGKIIMLLQFPTKYDIIKKSAEIYKLYLEFLL